MTDEKVPPLDTFPSTVLFQSLMPPNVLRLDLPAPPTFGSNLLGGLGTFGRFGFGGGLGLKLMHGYRPVAPGADIKPLCVAQCMEGAPILGAANSPLAGFAAATLGTGLLVALVESAQHGRSFAPNFRLMLTPKRTLASAVWSF